MSRKIVIIGAGPTGLGAAYRLYQLGYGNWEIYEKNDYVGGLSASFIDGKGFTWDIGGHVLYPRYDYVEQLVDKLLGDEYVSHQREAWIWLLNCWIPYPFQNNIRHLPKDALLECLLGLIDITGKKSDPNNFLKWILGNFGEGIAKYFMLPINLKSWAYPLELMDKDWIAGAGSISVLDIKRVLKNVIYEQDEIGWGANSHFKFPLHGGTGGLFNKFVPYISEHLSFGKEVIEINTKKKLLKFSDGGETHYDIVINTIPLDQLVFKMLPREDFLMKAAKALKHNGVYSVGIGIEKPCPSNKCWMYFPEDNCHFYRATYFSNYSPNNVPNSQFQHSLMCETSYSEHKPEDSGTIIDKTIEGLINTKLIDKADVKLITTAYLIQADYAYPVPSLTRDKALSVIQTYLEQNGILSRGRFGAWKYELSSMDQSIMQGVEAIDHIFGVDTR